MATMKWWDDLWLNEGFASILMYFGINHIYPEWDAVSITHTHDGRAQTYTQADKHKNLMMYRMCTHAYMLKTSQKN